jgi:hypothetical protein
VSGGSLRLGAVVIAARGGRHLEDALERAGWADERVVADPADVVPPASLPAGVRRVVDPAVVGQMVTADWLVLLREEDHVDPAAVAAARRALAAAADDDVFALPLRVRALTLDLAPRRPRVMIARRGTPLAIVSGLAIGFPVAGRRLRTIAATIQEERGASLSEALELLGADADVVAAVADRLGHPPLGYGVGWRAAGALVRTLTARSPGARLGLGRWALAVLDAYRVVVTHAKLWERRRQHAVELL